MLRDQHFYDHHYFDFDHMINVFIINHNFDFDHSPLVGRLLLLEGVPAQVQAASGDDILDDNDNNSSK